MCGIAGVFYSNPDLNKESLANLVKNMTDRLIHRGPDDSGIWVDEKIGIGLGHRRLSILDLSSTGHQPMISSDQRYVISFNGEIYNFQEIRKNLEEHFIKFRGSSDTEVMLESIARFGLEQTLKNLNGMFAFALWDRQQRCLVLGRDRIGKKPLYYGLCRKTFMFASELKALTMHPDFNSEIDRSALGQFIQYSWVNGPQTIYKYIKKLPPGSIIKIYEKNILQTLKPETYWSVEKIADFGLENSVKESYDETKSELDSLLRDAVARRMIADVEYGALLSGGIDSSLVTSIMQAQSASKIKTYSIGFLESSHNEAVYAKQIAEYLKTDHNEMYVTPQECMDVIPKLPEIYDEPFGDVSQIPTYLVSKLARNDVKFVLSGDGGDELFAGYTRYLRCLNHWKKQNKFPAQLKPMASKTLSIVADLWWSCVAGIEIDYSAKGWRSLGEKMEKRSGRIEAKSALELFIRMLRNHKNEKNIVYQNEKSITLLSEQSNWPEFSEPILNMMFIDTCCYLPDDILVKLDRASMANSLEARCPLLDQNIIEYSWRLPYSAKVNENGGKRILKDILGRYLPPELTDRKKMGFGVPIGSWLKGPLKNWAEDLLEPAKLKNQSFLNEKNVQKLWLQHQSGWRNHDDILWSILMFQAWHEHYC